MSLLTAKADYSPEETGPEKEIDDQRTKIAMSVAQMMKRTQAEKIEAFTSIDKTSITEREYTLAYQELLKDLGYTYFPNTLQIPVENGVYTLKYTRGKNGKRVHIEISLENTIEKTSKKTGSGWPLKIAA